MLNKKFTKAIVRTPCKNIVEGITSANLGKPDYNKALGQHHQYIKALQYCGLEVIILPADERYPDSTFVEDTALLTPHCAIFTNPGAESRKGEIAIIRETIASFYSTIESIKSPGAVEAGDIMMVGNTYYIGLSERTNEEGANQMIRILRRYGMNGIPINTNEMLHLKTGLSYIENNYLKTRLSGYLSNPSSHLASANDTYMTNCTTHKALSFPCVRRP